MRTPASHWWILALIFLLGAALRFYHLGDWSLSNDELSGLARTHYDSLEDVIQHGVRTEGHPAGYHLFAYAWTGLADTSNAAYRFPFALIGTLSIGLFYLLGARWFGRSVGLMAAAAFATLAFPILYSQLARPYSLALAASLA
ncbi:MAG: glycosyltransferase family 39 protein, partial [Bacteroidota bacterium]